MKIFVSLFATALTVLTVSCAVCSVGHHAPVARDYHFEGTISREVLEEFGLEYQDRGFSFSAMRYRNGQQEGKWSNPNAIVPDMSQLETRMWFYFLSCSYIDIGVEAIHFGQVEIMDNADPDHVHWDDMLGRVRRYAAKHARRRMLLADAHVPTGGVVLRDGRLLLDFHSFPLRIEERSGPGQQAHLKMNHVDSIYGKSNGGTTPSGWRCESLPYIVEFDNFGSSGKEGQNVGQHWIWGYDEIGWFARQECEYRDQWLYYAWCWIRKHDANGYLQMPGARVLHSPAEGKRWYWANTASDACPTGFGQEETIKTIWASDL